MRVNPLFTERDSIIIINNEMYIVSFFFSSAREGLQQLSNIFDKTSNLNDFPIVEILMVCCFVHFQTLANDRKIWFHKCLNSLNNINYRSLKKYLNVYNVT